MTNSFLTSNTIEKDDYQNMLKKHEKLIEVDSPSLLERTMYSWVPKLRMVIEDGFTQKIKLPYPLKTEAI